MDTSPLFQPVTLGDWQLKNHIIMAPLTRNRAHPDGVPSQMMADYYAQRASAGLIIAEATQIAPEGIGYINTPGIYTPQHIAGWQPVTQAVHDAGGLIINQLWHVGRISHNDLQPGGAAPLAPSALAAEGAMAFTKDGFVPTATPRALEVEEIQNIVGQYARAARNAVEAGFDGVEIHGANGYLIDQFIRDKANHRTDAYGGPAENRLRFLLEVVEAVCSEIGAGKVGLRLSPTGKFNGNDDNDPVGTFGLALEKLAPFSLAYLHFIERFVMAGAPTDEDDKIIAALRDSWSGTYLANGDYAPGHGADLVAAGKVDAMVYGRPFISNPDLPARIQQGGPYTDPNPDTFYTPGPEGYVDYASLPG